MAGASYWKCPICLRRVPERVTECYCGRKRGPDDGPDEPEAKNERGPLFAVAGVAAMAAVVAYFMLRPAPPAPAAPPESAVEASAPPSRPAFPGESAARPAPAPTFASSEGAAAVPPQSAGEAVPVAPKPTPTPADSVDAQRERGAAAYEAAMKNLAGRLSTLRAQVKRYNEQCSGGLQMGPSGAMQVQGCDAPRDEIGEALREIQAALDEADEAARRAWLEPGVQRAIRERSGMDDVALGETLLAARAATRR